MNDIPPKIHSHIGWPVRFCIKIIQGPISGFNINGLMNLEPTPKQQARDDKVMPVGGSAAHVSDLTLLPFSPSRRWSVAVGRFKAPLQQLSAAAAQRSVDGSRTD